MRSQKRPPVTKSKRIMIAKIVAVLFAAFLFIMPENLNAIPNIDNRVLVTALGLDLQGDKIQAVVQMVIPQSSGTEGGGGNGESNEIGDGDGSSVADAINRLSISIGRKTELGQCDFLIIGPKIAASEKLLPSLAYLLGSGDLSPGASLVYSPELPVKEFMQNANELGKTSGSGLNSYIKYSKEGTHLSTTTILNFLSNQESASGASTVPCITIKKQQEASGGAEKQASGGGEDKQKSQEKKADEQENGAKAQGGQEQSKNKMIIFSADTAAVFQNGRLAVQLADYQSKGITWFDAYSKAGLIQLEKFDFNGEDFNPVPAQLKHKQAKMKVNFKNGLPVLTLQLKAYLQLQDKHILDSRPGNNNDIQKALVEGFTDKISNEIKNSLDACKETGIDFMNIKTQFHRYKSKQFAAYQNKDGTNLFQDLTVEYKITCSVK